MPVLEKTDPKPLFVYGDLRKGEKSHGEMRGTGFLGEVSTTEEYEKKPEGLAHGRTSVKGELYKVSPGKLKKLDDFELDRYERSPVRLDGGETAQAYMLKKTGGLLTKALVPLSSEARNIKPDDSAEGKAKADELREVIAKKFNVSPYLAGSMATGLNLPGKYDYDYGVRVTSQPKFEKLVKRLESSGTFKPSQFNKPGTDYHVFQGELGGVPVDLSVMYGDKGKVQREAFQAARKRLDADEAKKLDLLKQKAVAKNLLAPIPIVGKKLVKTFKRETDAELGLPRFKREAIPGVEKSAAVPREVKQYRRALQLLQGGEHSFHGTRDIAAVARSGHLLPSAEGALGKGVYWAKDVPDINYFNGGVVTPTAGLRGHVLAEAPRPHAKGLAASSYFTTEGPHALGKGDYVVEGFSRNPQRMAEQSSALGDLQRKSHVRRLSQDALTNAYSELDKGAEITEEQLRRLQRADVYGHRTSNLDPIISSGQLLSAAQAARQGLLKDYEATGQRGTRVALDAPAKLRSEVFMTKGLLPAGEDYGRYGVLFEKKKARPSTYLNTIPQEHLHEGKWQSKLHYVVPDEEYETWAAKHPDAPILRESQVPEGKRLAPKAGLGELAQRVLAGPTLFQRKEEVAPKLAEVATKLLPHQKRVVERIQQADQPGLLVAHGLGSGKTLTSIAAQDALGMPSTVILPAALQANYEKEREKHLAGERQPVNMLTLQAAARRGEAPANPLLIVDEAHRLREPSSKGLKAVKGTEAQKRMLLTATPFYNAPSDIAPLINVVAGDKLLPEAKPEFEGQFVREREVKPGLWGRWMRHETPGLVREVNPATAPKLQEILHKYVDYHPSSVEGFPSVTREDVRVPMSRQQLKVYDTLMHEAPPWVAAKIKSGLPPSKQESQDLNAFLSGVRQVSNTTEGFQPGQDPHSPKIQAAFENLKKTLDANERAKAIVYSNYLESGISPYKARLQAAGIPFGEFTGEMKKKDRDQMVRDYNEGKLRTLLLSSAGGEGLDLKGTRLIQTLDPHWNIEKIRQVEGRGVRYGSHADLPEEERNVAIQRYLATRPASGIMERLGLKKPGGGVDEYLANMSEEKERLHEQFRKLLPGYEKKAAAHHDFLAQIRDQAKEKGYDIFAVVGDPKAKDGGSIYHNTSPRTHENAVHHARQKHMSWEKKHGVDPNHDWSKKASAPKGYYKGLPSDPEGVKFKVDFQGIEVRVERPKGFIMVGKDAKGVNWARRYKLDYGYIPKTLGGDGDGLDVFLGPDKKANEAFWAIQRKDDGTFDEYKIFLGFPDRDAAAAAYRQHIPKKYLKGIITMKVQMMRAMLGKVEPEELMKSASLASFMDELAWIERTSCA